MPCMAYMRVARASLHIVVMARNNIGDDVTLAAALHGNSNEYKVVMLSVSNPCHFLVSLLGHRLL